MAVSNDRAKVQTQIDTAGTGDPVPVTLVPADGLGALSLDAAARAWADANGFTAKLGQSLRLPGADGRLGRVLIGWGDAAARARERLHLGDFARGAPPGAYRLETPLEPEAAEEAALAWRLGRYRFDRYKPREEKPAVLRVAGVDEARIACIAEGVFLARDLINTPANEMGPAALEAACRALASRHGAAVAVTTGEELLAGNFP